MNIYRWAKGGWVVGGMLLLLGAVAVYAAEEQPTVSLEFKDADIRDVIETLGRETGLNFVVDPRVRGPVTVTLRDVTVEQALKLILDAHGYTYTVEDGVYLIKPKERQVAPPVPQVTPTLQTARPPAVRRPLRTREAPETEPQEAPEEKMRPALIQPRNQDAPVLAMLLGGMPLYYTMLNPYGGGGYGGFGGGYGGYGGFGGGFGGFGGGFGRGGFGGGGFGGFGRGGGFRRGGFGGLR